MGRGIGSSASRRGLWRLMLKLPSMRGRLQILAATSTPLDGMLEAYEEASTTLERMTQEREAERDALIDEYQTVCSEIETDVVRYVLEHTHIP